MSGHSSPEKNETIKPLLEFLEDQGWRAIRHESGFVPGAGSFGEKGMPDYQFIRYLENGVSCTLWIEAKPPGYKPRCNCRPAGRNPETGRKTKAHECRDCGQKRWAKTERERGAIVLRVDDMEVFEEWYRKAFHWLPANPRQKSLFESGKSGAEEGSSAK